jgi:hypothetical protein
VEEATSLEQNGDRQQTTRTGKQRSDYYQHQQYCWEVASIGPLPNRARHQAAPVSRASRDKALDALDLV